MRAGEGGRVGDIVRAVEGGIMGGYSEGGRWRNSGRIYGEWVREGGWKDIVRVGE